MNRYRVLLPLSVDTANGSYKQGEEFELETTAEDEAIILSQGLVEIVPREYRNITENTIVHDVGPGETFKAALDLANEQILLDGGFIEKVEPAPPVKRSRKKKEDGS